MPSTQAYSVNWTVTIQPEGDVSQDAAEIKIIQEENKPNSATVTLDTSERPHALEEQKDISITITDQNNTVTFDGYTDSVKDDEENPIVTVDAREADGLLKDATAAGSIDEDNLFQVIDAIVDTSAGKVREITFDPSDLESTYGTFAGSVDFGVIDIAHVQEFNVSNDEFNQHETASNGYEAEIRIDSYVNTTSVTYSADITGQDDDGNTVTASIDLPPGDSVEDAYGTDTFKLALSGGNQKWVQVDSITTDVSPGQYDIVSLGGQIFNYVKTDWNFSLANLTSVDEAVRRIVSYISGLDEARSWEYYVNDFDELVVQPESTASPDRYLFREGDNVLKPAANRDLDGVRNFIKVNGSGSVNIWAWAYDGDLQWSLDNPFETGEYPDAGVIYDSSPAPQNDIDQINLRAESLSSNTFTSFSQALDIAKEALEQFLRTPVSGQAPVPGVHPADPGDEAEVYYPSRGIPSKVASNIFRVKSVEYSVTPEAAKTAIDFGTSKRNLGDLIGSGGSLIRNDISNNIQQFSDRSGGTAGGGQAGGLLVVGTLQSRNDDGTWVVDGEDGETYNNVRVI
jgi:outer membrane protein OmpA-like peptidoglycan-associated protein